MSFDGSVPSREQLTVFFRGEEEPGVTFYGLRPAGSDQDLHFPSKS